MENYTKTVKICGMDVSEVRQRIHDLLAVQDGPSLTFSASPGEVDIEVSFQSEQETEAKEKVKEVVRELKVRFGSSIFTTKPKRQLSIF